jgi:apolipoprotein D and lipocalin family protein
MQIIKDELTVVENIDIRQYLGKWHEIARFDFYYERGYHGATAEYSLLENGRIKVENRAFTDSGKEHVSIGSARVVDSSNAKLKVNFLPCYLSCFECIASGDYWILRIDEDYQTALVGSPSREYLWILHRKSKLNKQILNSYLSTATKLGFDISKLVFNDI